jgi:phage-related protein
MREVEFYRTGSGRSPVDDFLSEVPPEAKAKIFQAIEVVRSVQHPSTEYLKKLRGTDGLWEIRAQHRGNAYRLISFFDGPRVVVVLTAFAKKTDRVPSLELEVAHRRRRDYASRRSQHG